MAKKAMKLRSNWKKKGINAPPIMITSVTKRCNLKCKGCYAMVNAEKNYSEVNDKRWMEIFMEARELGISFIIIAGGNL